VKELDLANWGGGSRGLLWCACFDAPCSFAKSNPRLCFDSKKVTFEEINPLILCGNEVVGKILVLRIKEHGCTCVIESNRMIGCILPGGYRNPRVDNPHCMLEFIYYKSRPSIDGVEIIENMMIDKNFFDKYEWVDEEE